METSWQIETSHASQGKFQRFAKKHRDEYAALFANLDKLMRLLRAGHKIGAFKVGFFRSESEGLYRIGQTGIPSARESRLYVFPDCSAYLMYVLNIGTKNSQQEDIIEAVKIVRQI